MNSLRVLFILILFLIFGYAIGLKSAHAGPVTPGGSVPSVIVGGSSNGSQAGRVFTDTTNLIQLRCFTTGAHNCTFRKTSGTAGYTPSGALKFKLVAWAGFDNEAPTTGFGFATLSYGTNDVLIDTVTVITGQVFIGGSSSLAQIGYRNLTGQQMQGGPLDFTVPNGDYLEMTGVVGTELLDVWGYETP